MDEANLGLIDLRLISRKEETELKGKEADLAQAQKKDGNRDLLTLTGRDNLCQALYNRLRTPVGELASLGHPNYGSRLFELVGEPNNHRTSNLAKAYARESVLADQRVKTIESITVTKTGLSSLEINISIIPIDSNIPVEVIYPVHLEGNQT